MIYFGMPFVMWALLAPSFRKQLTAVFGYDTERAKAITRKAKSEYRRIIAGLPEFEKGDRRRHDDKAREVVLPNERKEQIHRKGYCGHESHRRAKGG